MNAVLFDFNGTLVFDSLLHEQAWIIFLEKTIGRTVYHIELVDHMHGRTNDKILEYFLQRELTEYEADQMSEEKEAIYRQLCKKTAYNLVEGAAEFFEIMKKQHIPFAVATSSTKSNVDFYFETLGLSRWFGASHFIYNDGTLPGKPKPDIYLRTAKQIGVDISRCVIFEDSTAGILSAKNAHPLKVVGIAPTKGESEQLRVRWGITAVTDYTSVNLSTLFEPEIAY